RRLKELIHAPERLRVQAQLHGFTARLLERSGYQAGFVSGALSRSNRDRPDANTTRKVLATVAAVLLSCVGAAAAAADYPTKPVRLVVVYPPGGGIDLLARAMGPQFTESWGQPVVVDNRPGAGTTIAAATVAKAPADGYTLLMTDVSFAITPSLYPKLPYDAQKSFEPVSLLNLVNDVLVVHPSLPVKSVKELIE